MAYYGPKTLDSKGDTVYYTIPESALDFGKIWQESYLSSDSTVYTIKSFEKDTLKKQGAQLILFIDKNQQEKLGGLLEFEKYKKEKLDMLDVYIIQCPNGVPEKRGLPGYRQDYNLVQKKNNENFYETYLKDTLGITMSNFYYRTLLVNNREEYDSIRKLFFNQKPIHVFNYFAVLVDKDRHIRGYYDPTYISEVKRMIEEYKHLVLKDEHANMQDVNKIERK